MKKREKKGVGILELTAPLIILGPLSERRLLNSLFNGLASHLSKQKRSSGVLPAKRNIFNKSVLYAISFALLVALFFATPAFIAELFHLKNISCVLFNKSRLTKFSMPENG